MIDNFIHNDGYWILLTGILVAIPCSLLGSLLVLRRTVMIGDAISHAVLPGIVIAFLIVGSLNSIWLVLGASLVGIIATFLVEFINKKGNVQADAAIGITFTWLFALGVILISTYTSGTDLDQECVLYGHLEYVSIDTIITSSGMDLGPTVVWYLTAINILVFAFYIVFYKELFITTFDPAFASSIGISSNLWYYLLMACVSLVTVGSFQAVGAILVVTFIVTPAASAYLLTNKFNRMLLLACIFGILSCVLGYILADLIHGISTAGSMATCSGILFVLSILFSPTQGVIFSKRQK